MIVRSSEPSSPEDLPLFRGATFGKPAANRDSFAQTDDNTIMMNDNRTIKRYRPTDDGIDVPYSEQELQVRYDVTFSRVPVNERCVFCNAAYLGDTDIKHNNGNYVLRYHVWYVDFLRANNINFTNPVEGLLLIGTKRWRNTGLTNPKVAFSGLCAVKADKGREVVAVETNLEARL